MKTGKRYRAIMFQIEDLTLEDALASPTICY